MVYCLLIYMVFYILYCTKKNGKILISFSQTAYVLKNKNIFFITFWLVGLVLIFPLSQICTPFALIFSLGMFLVGISPYYKTYGKKLHFFGGYISGISSQILVSIVNPLYLLFWIPYFLYLIFLKDSNSTFWAELVCFINLFLAILL